MISGCHTGNHSDFIQQFYPMRYNSNVLEIKASWYLYRKINFKLLINNQLGQAPRGNISKMFGCLFLSTLGLQPNISCNIPIHPKPEHPSFFPSTKVWIYTPRQVLLNLFESVFLSLTLWIVCIHQSYTADASLEDYILKE